MARVAKARPPEKATTVRMDSRTLKRLDGLARARSRSRTWMIREAVDRYLDYEEWFVRQVKEGLDEVKRGDVIDHDDVVRELEAKLETPMGPRRQRRSGSHS